MIDTLEMKIKAAQDSKEYWHELAELQDSWIRVLEEKARKLENVAQAFLDSFPKHYHGFPGKLEWWELHALKQALDPRPKEPVND